MAKIQLDLSSDLEDEIKTMLRQSAREIFDELSRRELQSKEFMNLKESAEFVGVSFNTLVSWIQNYGLQYIRIGGKKFVEKKVLVEFLRSHTI